MSNLVEMIKAAVEGYTGTQDKFILSGVSVDLFVGITDYINNRPFEERAVKQAKAVKNGTDTSSHDNADFVAIGVLDPVVNKTLWKRIERKAKKLGTPNTLPYIKLDGHTRGYGWSTVSPFKKDMGAKNLFERPVSLFVSVYRNKTDEQFYKIVDSYCKGENKATNAEVQHMNNQYTDLGATSDFVAKDSWKTAFRTIESKWGKDTFSANLEFKEELKAIDKLKIDTDSKSKKAAGVRAAMIITCRSAMRDNELGIWSKFWKDFFSAVPKDKDVIALVEEITNLSKTSVGKHSKFMEACEDAFNTLIIEEPTPEPETTAQEKAALTLEKVKENVAALTDEDIAEATAA